MDAATFKLKTPQMTGGRSHTPLAKTEHMNVGPNYYSPGRKNKLHTHPGEDHIFPVVDGQATFHNKEHQATDQVTGAVSKRLARRRFTTRNIRRRCSIKVKALCCLRITTIIFRAPATRPLALFRVSAKKGNPKVVRIDAEGNKRTEEENEFVIVDGSAIEGRFWEMS